MAAWLGHWELEVWLWLSPATQSAPKVLASTQCSGLGWDLEPKWLRTDAGGDGDDGGDGGDGDGW